MEFRPVEAVLFHVEGRTDGRDEANSCFSQIFKRAKKPIFISAQCKPNSCSVAYVCSTVFVSPLIDYESQPGKTKALGEHTTLIWNRIFVCRSFYEY